MITIQAPGGNVVVRADRPELQHHLSRRPLTTPAGVVVLLGDGGWDPATMTLRCRVADTGAADGVVAWRALLQAARTATALVLHDSSVDVQGFQGARSVQRGTYWDVELRWRPIRLRGARMAGATVVPTLPALMISPTQALEIKPGVALLLKPVSS